MSALSGSSSIHFHAVASDSVPDLYASKDSNPPVLTDSPSQAAVAIEVGVPIKSVSSTATVEPKLEKNLVSTSRSSSRKIAKSGHTSALHRVAEVRVSQGISERTMCRRLNVDTKQLREIENPQNDLSVSQLLEIREVLEVPFADLLVESDSLAPAIQDRAKLLRIMKTAVSIKECKLPPRASRLAEMLCEQLVDLMPELKEIGGWPEFGSRRGNSSVARVLENQVDTSNLRLD